MKEQQVHIDNNFKNTSYAEKVDSKGNHVLGLILISFTNSTRDILKKLFKALVGLHPQ